MKPISLLSTVSNPFRNPGFVRNLSQTSLTESIKRGIAEVFAPPRLIPPSENLRINPARATPFPDGILAKKIGRFVITDEYFTLFRLYQHPTIVKNYWRLSKTMQKKGLIPLTHGQSATWLVPQRILQAIGYEHCQLLRTPTTKTVAEVRSMIESSLQKQRSLWPLYWTLYRLPSFITEKGHLDHSTELREYMLSTNIGLFHCEHHESPLSLVFGGGSKWIQFEGNVSILGSERSRLFAYSMIAVALLNKGISPEAIVEVFDKIHPLFNQAENLRIGQILILGVPQSLLASSVYHSKKYGTPTQMNLEEVLDSLSSSEIPSVGCQARLLLCKETLDPKSGIEMINLMDEEAISNYCGELDSPDESEIQEIVNKKVTDEEERNREAFTNLKNNIDKTIKELELPL
jgi:hypothetical protein